MTSNLDNSQIGLGQLIRLILMQSKLIILIAFVGTSLGVMNYIFSERLYKVTSMIQVFSNQDILLNRASEIDLFSGNTNTSEIGNISSLYSSRSHLINVIKNKRLNLEASANEYAIREAANSFEIDSLKSMSKAKFQILFHLVQLILEQYQFLESLQQFG